MSFLRVACGDSVLRDIFLAELGEVSRREVCAANAAVPPVSATEQQRGDAAAWNSHRINRTIAAAALLGETCCRSRSAFGTVRRDGNELVARICWRWS